MIGFIAPISFAKHDISVMKLNVILDQFYTLKKEQKTITNLNFK